MHHHWAATLALDFWSWFNHCRANSNTYTVFSIYVFFSSRWMSLFSAQAKLLWSHAPCSCWRPALRRRRACASATWRRFWRLWSAAWLWLMLSRLTATPQDTKTSPLSEPPGSTCWRPQRKSRSVCTEWCFLFVKYTPVFQVESQLFYYRCRGNIDHTDSMISDPHMFNGLKDSGIHASVNK